MNSYDLLRQDRNRNRGGVACSIRNDISYIQKHYFPEEIKIFSLKFFYLKLSQYWLELFIDHLPKLTFSTKL